MNEFAQTVYLDIKQQFEYYKKEVNVLNEEYIKLKAESKNVSKLIKQIKDETEVNGHISKLMNLVKDKPTLTRIKKGHNKELKEIFLYFDKIQQLSKKSLQIIFDIRQFFTGQDFEVYIENKGKVFSFSMKDIQNHIDIITSSYTDSLEKLINNMSKDSKALATELSKLTFSLKALEGDKEIENVQSYLQYVNDYINIHKNDIIKGNQRMQDIPENRRLEAAIYLNSRNEKLNFLSSSDKKSAGNMLHSYISKGGVSDNIAMYKLGDSVRKVNENFKNIEIKMHTGTISLTMIANGIKKLNTAFTSNNVRQGIIKFFSVNEKKLSSPIEKEANAHVEEEINKMLDAIFDN